MTFWDTSAILPLVFFEDDSKNREHQLEDDLLMVVWYGTAVEIESAICRRSREKSLVKAQAVLARDKIQFLAESWLEIAPSAGLRKKAIRLLRVHVLRAGDAFQLAAALIAVEDHPSGNRFLTGDHGLKEAAEAEGFLVS